MGVICLLLPIYSQAYYALTASPTLPAEQAKEIYEPVAKLLSEKLGIEVGFHYENNWQEFSKKLLSDEYHLVFSEPHITAYLADIKSDYAMDAPLKLSGNIVFHVVVKKENKSKTLKSLGAARICMLPSPNFSGVIIKKEFSNPVVQPVIVATSGNFESVYRHFQKGVCDAAVIDEASYKKHKASGGDIYSIYTSSKTPNTSLAVSQRVSVSDRSIIIDALTNPENQAILKALTQVYGDENTTFEKTSREEFIPFNILPGVVWGW